MLNRVQNRRVLGDEAMQLEPTPQADKVTANGISAGALLPGMTNPAEEPRTFYGPPDAPVPDPNSIRFAHGLLVAIPAAAIVWIVLGGLLWLMLR